MNHLRKKFFFLFVYLILPLLLVELWVNFYLFEHASYTNSISLDQTIKALKSSREKHEIFFFGDSARIIELLAILNLSGEEVVCYWNCFSLLSESSKYSALKCEVRVSKQEGMTFLIVLY